jgi:glycosyltransferase involved in cell wall biosynthesis
MSNKSPPLVSVVTPMYNTIDYIEECIESVQRQTYEHWDYVIVNNCSTDGSAEIARRYAELDPRIRVVDNTTLLPALANHNHALRQISPASKYCKMVFSDDWLFPRCLEEMVALAEAQPSVGVVGAYNIEGAGLSHSGRCVDGRDLSRWLLLEEFSPWDLAAYVGRSRGYFASHALLYRSDLVRSRDKFFNEANLQCDRETFIDLLRGCDFGFVHQVLTFTRERTGSLTDFAIRYNTFVGGALYDVTKYGPDFLSPDEFRDRRAQLISEYYNYLAISLVMGRRDPEFWNYHRRKLEEAGVRFSRRRLSIALLARCLKAVTNPMETLKKLKLVRTRKHYGEA